MICAISSVSLRLPCPSRRDNEQAQNFLHGLGRSDAGCNGALQMMGSRNQPSYSGKFWSQSLIVGLLRGGSSWMLYQVPVCPQRRHPVVLIFLGLAKWPIIWVLH